MTIQLEYREITEVRAVEAQDQMVIEGVVNNIGEWSKPIGGVFREKINPGVFTRAIEKALNEKDIFFLHQHDSRALPLASIKSNTLELKEVDNKLMMRAVLPNTSFARDVYELTKSGVLSEFSFGFSKPKSEWTKGQDGLKERSITEFDLSEISIVRTGAYNHTQACARALEDCKLDEDPTDNTDMEAMQRRLKLAKMRVM